MLTKMLRIFGADYQTLPDRKKNQTLLNCVICLSYFVYIFRCVNSGSSLSAKTIQSYLSKRYFFRVYMPVGSPKFMFQVSVVFQSEA